MVLNKGTLAGASIQTNYSNAARHHLFETSNPLNALMVRGPVSFSFETIHEG